MNLLQIHEPGETPLPHEGALAVGIDLGTTHSVVAIVREGKVQVIADAHERALLPSVVYYGADGRIEAGHEASTRYGRGEAGAIASVKRLMGRGAEDIKPLLGNLPYDIAAGKEGMVRLRAGGREVTPVEVSAEILKELKRIAEAALGEPVTQAVITVPAYFDDAARTATKDAARLAGLEVLRLVNEPTAAALAYGLESGVEGIYAVYDLGGGTFDLSLLKLEKGVFQVLATAGDTALGGDDFDQAIAAWLLSELGVGDAVLSSGEVGAIVARAREAKHALSEAEEVVLVHGGKERVLGRGDYNELIRPYVERSIEVCRSALLDARLTTLDVKGVVLVGGSTRVPMVREYVEAFFGSLPLTDAHPDEVVAAGAALQAEGLTQGSDNLLLDVVPLSLGLETMGGLTEKLIYRNTPIPVSVTQEFTTHQDGQDGMWIHVVQGEREMVGHNRSLARFELRGIPLLPAGIARVAVTLSVDADGLLTVAASEKTTGIKQAVHVKPSYGLPPEEIERMLTESMQHARKDITQRLLVESRVEAGRAIAELESAMRQDADLMEEAERARLLRQIGVLRNVARGEDRDYIDAELQELGRLAQGFAERRMDRAVAVGLKGAGIDEVSG